MEAIKKMLADKEKPLKWLFYGDSITHGAVHTFGMRDYTELFSERIRTELGRMQDIVIKTAISGNTTPALLDTFDWRVTQFKPDVVFLMIGMNDCSENNDITVEMFEENLNTLAEKVSALGAKLVMQTTCPILPGTAPERYDHFPAYMDKIRNVAEERNLPLIDHTAIWNSEANKPKHYYWMSNAFHPNGAGHQAFVLEIYKALGIYDEKSNACKLFTP